MMGGRLQKHDMLPDPSLRCRGACMCDPGLVSAEFGLAVYIYNEQQHVRNFLHGIGISA